MAALVFLIALVFYKLTRKRVTHCVQHCQHLRHAVAAQCGNAARFAAVCVRVCGQSGASRDRGLLLLLKMKSLPHMGERERGSSACCCERAT